MVENSTIRGIITTQCKGKILKSLKKRIEKCIFSFLVWGKNGHLVTKVALSKLVSFKIMDKM